MESWFVRVNTASQSGFARQGSPDVFIQLLNTGAAGNVPRRAPVCPAKGMEAGGPGAQGYANCGEISTPEMVRRTTHWKEGPLVRPLLRGASCQRKRRRSAGA